MNKNVEMFKNVNTKIKFFNRNNFFINNFKKIVTQAVPRGVQ